MENVLYELTFPIKSIVHAVITMIILISFVVVVMKKVKLKTQLLAGITIEHDIPNNSQKSFSKFIVVFLSALIASILPLIFIFIDIDEYNKLSNMIKTGDYLVVEGIVEEFSPMPKGGHANESFYIEGVFFEYSDYNGGVGYNSTYHYGGVIRENGQRLQIVYCEKEDSSKVILKIIEKN